MDLFEKPVYLYGKIMKNKYITPYKSYELTLPKDLKADYLPAKLENDKLFIFYNSEIFNSYILSVEENVCTLFHLDGKLTITNEKIEEGRIYTFKIDKEDEMLRKVSLYKFNTLYPGSKTVGRVISKKGKFSISTIYGEGELGLQNNSYKKKIEVLLYRKDESLHFVQIDNPVTSKITVKIDSQIGYYTVSDKNIKGILFTGNKYKVGDSVEVIPKDNNLGFYIFEEYKTIYIGQEIKAEIIKREKGKTILRYGGHLGSIKGNTKNKGKVKGTIMNIEDDIFELQSNTKVNNKGMDSKGSSNKDNCKGMKNVDMIKDNCKGSDRVDMTKDNMKGSNRVDMTKDNTQEKPHKQGLSKSIHIQGSGNLDKQNNKHLPVSIPFDLPSEDEETKDEQLVSNLDPNLEYKRSKLQNDEDFVMDIKAYPGKAFPILKYFQYLLETNRQEDAVNLFYEYYPSLIGRDKDDLSIAFVNYLIYTNNPNLNSIVKKLSQNCFMHFLDTISSNSDNLEISKLYYSMYPNKNSYGKYLKTLFSSDIKEGYKLMEGNPKYLHLAIPFLYKLGDNPRNRIEKLIPKNREAWFEYLNHETGEYKRHLFRRVIEYDWNKKDMKKFYKMWLEFEKEEGGDVEEVRSRAKEYVERVLKE